MGNVPESFAKFISFYFNHYKMKIPVLTSRDFMETMFWFTLKGLSHDWGQWWLLLNSDIVLSASHYNYIISHFDSYSGFEEEFAPEELLCYHRNSAGYQAWYDRLKSPGLTPIEKKRVLGPFYKNIAPYWTNVEQDKGCVHLALWASMFWFAGPDAEAWRSENHEVFSEVYENRVCYIHYNYAVPKQTANGTIDGQFEADAESMMVFTVDDLEFTERPLDHCTICYQSLPCVRQLQHEEGQHFICQQCAVDNFSKEYLEDYLGLAFHEIWAAECQHCMNFNCKHASKENLVERIYQSQNRLALEYKTG